MTSATMKDHWHHASPHRTPPTPAMPRRTSASAVVLDQKCGPGSSGIGGRTIVCVVCGRGDEGE
jgi:hypothetical protein